MRLVVGIKRDDDPAKHSQECGKETPHCLKTENLKCHPIKEQATWHVSCHGEYGISSY